MSSQENASPVEPGTILAGKYRVARVIGQGGMGVVCEARHTALDDRVALKFLTPEYAQHPEASARFLREARAAVKIKSEHVARVSDVGTLENGSPYMVMEFLEGSDLSHQLTKEGVLALHDAVDFVIQGCEAIAEAHGHGIVHRDLKPANLFLTKRLDGSPLVKVLDFGISKMSDSAVENLTKTMAAMGSALYMSPEQMQQTRGVDHRTDIYALGISLYELLAGKQPFYADTLPQLCAEVLTGTPVPLRQLRPEIPEEFARVLERSYARDRAQRYQSIAELVIGLAPFAPKRSQPTVDRIARMAGLEPPTCAQPPAPPPAAHTPPARGGTIAMQSFPSPPGAPPAADRTSGAPEAHRASSPQVPLTGGTIALDQAPAPTQKSVPGAAPASPAVSVPVVSPPPVTPVAAGPVTIPTDTGPTGSGIATASAPPLPPASGNKVWIAIAAIGVLLGGGAAVYFATRSGADPGGSQASGAGTPPTATATQTSATPTTTAAQLATSTATATEAPVATALPTAAPTDTPSASASTKAGPAPSTKVGARPTATAQTTTKTSLFDER